MVSDGDGQYGVGAPNGFVAVDELPDGLLDSTPSGVLRGPKRTLWGILTRDWQRVERAAQGHIAGLAAWSFHYVWKRQTFYEETAWKQRATVVIVQRDDLRALVGVRRRPLGNRMTRRSPPNTIDVGDDDFDRRHLVYGVQAAGALFTPQVRSILLSAPASIDVDLGRGWLVVITGGHEPFEPLIEVAHRLASTIPSAAGLPLDRPPRRGRFRRR